MFGCSSALAVGFAGVAHADDGEPSDKLHYEAPAACPSRAEFEEQVRARVSPGWAAGGDTRQFDVRIVRDARGVFVGTLTVRGAGREPNEREIRASTCKAVSTSLAVFMAIALAPSGAEPAPSAPPSPSVSPPSPEPELPTSPVEPSSSPPAPQAPPRPSIAHRPSAHWTLGSGFRATYLNAPGAAWGGRAFVDLTRTPARGGAGIAARLSWGWVDFSEHPARTGDVTFRLRTARVEGCARFTDGRFGLSPCAGIDLGSLTGDTPELRRASSSSAFWSAATATLRGSFALTPWLSLELEGSLLVPFQRPRFEVDEPLRTVYRPPAVLFEAGAGACLSGRFH
ncbi:hypothetical protein AKJ09_07247 [Labilithrix luteola]|uniref:Uncharacterized protein n=1 Tax=Labilithrix luteola TaxID=1391654 RepID=A0A0K1Q4B7_9BACT|nr:hypothetical protein [Labilithrix luteola]AKV00584.1 hypothetical protein AKJ09_07247 [Labilithrix luteola]